VIDVRLPTPDGQRLVEALRIAAGIAPRPADPAERRAYHNLAHQFGDVLAALPQPTNPTDTDQEGGAR
jgi:hypothetical protein